jgi:hypothetical protein
VDDRWFERIRFRLGPRGIRFQRLVQALHPFPAQHSFFEVPNGMFSGPMLAHEAGFIFAHLSSDFVNDLIDGNVHIVALRAGLERDVVATVQNDLGRVTVFLNIHNYLYFDNFRIIEVEACQPASAIFFHRLRDADVPSSHLDGWICILYLHIGALSIFGLMTAK